MLALTLAVPAFALEESDVEAAVSSSSREAVTGNVLVWFLCAVGFLKVSQKIDSFMASIGVNVGHTGGSMLGEAMVAFKGVSLAAGMAGKVVGNFADRASSRAGATASGSSGFLQGGLAGVVSRKITNDAVRTATQTTQKASSSTMSAAHQATERTVNAERQAASVVHQAKQMRSESASQKSQMGVTHQQVASSTRTASVSSLRRESQHSVGLGGRIFTNSMLEGGRFANDVIGMVAAGDLHSTGSITGEFASQALSSYMGITAQGDAAPQISYSDIEIGGGRITGTEYSPEHPEGISFGMYHSVTGDPVKGAKFQIWYGSNHTDTGELNDLGTYFSDASGKIILPEIKDGWYKVTELEPASGYALKEPATQECFISGGESKVLTFENTPLSAIIIRKVDSESGQPLEGAWFRIRYLGGTSGTGGTVVGEYKTSSNGTIVATGLKAGTYVCEEISAPDGYVITDAAETVYLSGKDQDVITVTFGNDKMGSLLIVKKDAVTGAPISDVEFFITDSDGSVIGNANGKYVTDSAGTIRIDGLTPGMTVIAKEVRTKEGYILDDTPQSIKIKRNAVMTLEFRNQPKGGVLVKKVDAVTNAPISDVEFFVTDSDGNLIGNANGKFVTDSAGTFTLTDIAPGTTLVVKETRAKAGYILDDTPQTVKVKSNEVTTLEFRNQPKGNLIIVKQDSVTKEPLEGVQFKIVYADGSYVDAEGGTLSSTGLYWTDKAGKISISGISGTIVATEVKSIPGYTIDENTRTQTVVVNPNDTQTLHFYNTPIGGVEIIKVNEDNHSERIPNTTYLSAYSCFLDKLQSYIQYK